MKSISWKGSPYYLILPLTILIYYILILKGNVDNRIFVYDGSGNVYGFIFLIPMYYFSIYNQSVRNKYILTISTSILILVIGEISTILYTLILSTPTDIYIAPGQSGVVYALYGIVFINLLWLIIHYKKEMTEGILSIITLCAIILFIISAIPLIYPQQGFDIMNGVAYQEHIIAYFLGIIVGLVMQVLLFENFGIYSKVSIFLNGGFEK
jgi:hypothetical protein